MMFCTLSLTSIKKNEWVQPLTQAGLLSVKEFQLQEHDITSAFGRGAQMGNTQLGI